MEDRGCGKRLVKPQIITHGIGVNERNQCAHYGSARDIVAIKFKCCETFYACIHCHDEVTKHPPIVWQKDDWKAEVILCGNCHNTISIADYLGCSDQCPRCNASFNPGCANHYHFYFDL